MISAKSTKHPKRVEGQIKPVDSRPRTGRCPIALLPLVAAFLAVLLLGAVPRVGRGDIWGALRPQGSPSPNYPKLLVSADWLRDHLDKSDVTVVDARPRERFRTGHIPGACRFDARLGEGDVRSLGAAFGRSGISDHGTVVCVSDAADPGAAGKLLWLLELGGHRKVRVLNGGLERWTASGGELETGDPTPGPARFTALPDTSRIADFQYLRRRFGTKGTTVMDWRSPRQWASGHIPHSLPFPLDQLVGKDGQWLTGEQMRSVFKTWGPRPREYVHLDDEFIVMGDAPPGAVPVDPYLAARLAGIQHVRVYPEGFSGWRKHREAPVVRIIETKELRKRLHKSLGRKLPDRPPTDFIFFDLRGTRDYRVGHIPGAIHLSPGRFDAEVDSVVAKYWPGVDRERTPMVVYCYGPGCTRSRNCSTLAARRGFLVLEWYREGVQGWRGAGEKLVTP